MGKFDTQLALLGGEEVDSDSGRGGGGGGGGGAAKACTPLCFDCNIRVKARARLLPTSGPAESYPLAAPCQLKGEAAVTAVRAALAAGFRSIDTASVYRNEEEARPRHSHAHAARTRVPARHKPVKRSERSLIWG